MATLNAGIYGVDSNAPEIGALVDGVVTVATSTQLVLQTGAWLDSFTGSFFYTNNQLSSGTITGWKQTYNGVTTFEVTGSSVSVSQFLTWIANDDDATAVQTIFSGADTMNGSFSDDIFWGWNGNDRIRGSGAMTPSTAARAPTHWKAATVRTAYSAAPATT
ncbi:hypothetical protein [Phenylobacterium sp. J367]|uniref:hypothetical protein n=1 Tax=Phenylobacterium sp. J367 TaxID=2898435 RepID=UPI0021508C8C|nr:hypothetical protein [Phenylobacterium sp. J367]MCR5877407.1 hypothetical protein [Phenylobacterium sp. J367]